MVMLGKTAKKLYRKLEGGRLTGRVRLIKLPKDKDVGELGGIKGLKRNNITIV